MQLPTRILTKPATRPVAPGSGRAAARERWFTCDDGHEYTMRSVAAHLARHMPNAPAYQTIVSRMRRYGWDSPYILATNGHHGYALDATNDRRKEFNEGSAEWLAMGCNPRTIALMQIRQPGTWERQEMGR